MNSCQFQKIIIKEPQPNTLEENQETGLRLPIQASLLDSKELHGLQKTNQLFKLQQLFLDALNKATDIDMSHQFLTEVLMLSTITVLLNTLMPSIIISLTQVSLESPSLDQDLTQEN